MNITFIGGGSLRILPIMRSLLDNHKLFDGGSIRLVDLRLDRAEAVGRMIMRCPEFKNVNCRVLWTSDLAEGLDGTDVLYVTMAIEREPSLTLNNRLSAEYGIWTSDQLSANGAFLAARGANGIMSFAKKMEQCSPDGVMLIFANPVAVFSSMVNTHTKIKALGICEGFHNHKWDLPRMVYGENRHDDNIDVVAAGVNHLSFILRGSWNGHSIKEILDEKLLRDDWSLPEMGLLPITMRTMKLMQRLYKRFGTMIFSSEIDSFANIDEFASVFEDERELMGPHEPHPGVSPETLAEIAKAKNDARYDNFFKHIRDSDDSMWQQPYQKNRLFGKNSSDIANPVLAAMAGGEKFRIVASMPNFGAVKGFADNAALEYTMDIQGRNIIPVPDQYIPAPFHGIIAELSEYQTILSEAVAFNDPNLFANALEAYPMKRTDPKRQEYYCRMLDIYSDIPAAYQKARDYFKW